VQKNKNRIFDKVTDSLKVRTFFETQCRNNYNTHTQRCKVAPISDQYIQFSSYGQFSHLKTKIALRVEGQGQMTTNSNHFYGSP